MGFFQVRVLGGGHPIAGTRISRSVGAQWQLVGVTDYSGLQKWKIDPGILPVQLLFEAPSGYWPKPVVFSEVEGEAEVHLAPLPRAGPTGWWHDCLGLEAGQPSSGEGIRIGVLDTGCGPSPCLGHVVRAGVWLLGGHREEASDCADVGNHGTHVNGLIAARPCGEHDYAGIAPAATVVTGRVFSEEGKADQDDVANAIDALVEVHSVHLINLSLGGVEKSEIEREAILGALDRGALVLAASGNKAQDVEYPAAYPEVVAVSALGLDGEGSEMAKSGAYKLGSEPDHNTEGLYPADFACFGAEVSCVAPGVDIISTVPSIGEVSCEFTAMSGTSMSAPIACGALAILLATDAYYLRMDPDRDRADHALEVLRRSCRDLGFSDERQGAGLPTLSSRSS